MAAASAMTELGQPLPAEVLRGVRGLTAYQHYPVFSSAWLARRTALFAATLAVFGSFLLLVNWLASRDLGDAAVVAGSFVLGALLLSTVGPALATVVRHRRWPRRREARAVVLALLLGVVTSFVIDQVASDLIDARLGGPLRPAEAPSAPVMAINLVLLVAIYGLVGGGVALRRYLQEPALHAAADRERELAALRLRHRDLDAHLAVLQAQIEPHFLFNTLASVRSLIATDPAAATQTIDALVDYLRATIPRIRATGADSTLGQQLEICESYLKVMATRTGRLSHDIDAAPALRGLPFPPLLLMSLVENALKHGIEPRRGDGRVNITARRDGRTLVVSVVDDGVGLPDVPGTGVGLHNVREQLRARHGDGARLELSSGAAGTTATIAIELADTP
jgi:signal transduction histidine kinase